MLHGCIGDVPKGPPHIPCGEWQDGRHISLDATKNWRTNLKCKKWLSRHEEIIY